MSKTEPSFRETKFGILEQKEIEGIIFDNLIQTKAYIFKNYKDLDFNIDTFCNIHLLLCSNLYEYAGKYRKHNVKLALFEPIDYFKVEIEMKNFNEDIKERLKYLENIDNKKEFIAYIMWKLLWIHPFFDYNGRTTRLFGELFLLKFGIPLTNFVGKTRKDYNNAMKKATETGFFEDIIELI